jgi:hypothetical protein
VANSCSRLDCVRFLFGLLAAVQVGCSSDTPSGDRGGDRVVPVEIDDNGGCASPGPVTCYCDDGTASGTQTCMADGFLTPCTCPNSSNPAGGTGGAGGAGTGGSGGVVSPSEGEVCEDLKGTSGCAANSYKSEELPASILFLVDRSGSMLCNLPPLQDSSACELAAAPTDSAQPSKWEITTDALKTVFQNLLTEGSTASIGLSFFSVDNVCGVASEPTVGINALTGPQVAALEAALDATKPSGGTPIVGGTILSYAHLHQEASAVPGCTEPCGAPGNRFVVLLTDGADSCPDPTRQEDIDACEAAGSCTDYLVDSEAPKAVEANIRTFVIGAPGSEPARGLLSELAFVGGTAKNAGACAHDRSAAAGDCHFDMTSTTDFAADLAAALSDISGAALGCEFAVPDTGETVDPEFVNVQYRAGDGTAPDCLRFDDSAACDGGANGWQFAKNPDGSDNLARVVLCGAACDTVRADAAAQVDVILGCKVLLE